MPTHIRARDVSACLGGMSTTQLLRLAEHDPDFPRPLRPWGPGGKLILFEREKFESWLAARSSQD